MFEFVDSPTPEYVYCPFCSADRDKSTLEDGCCPHCHNDITPAPASDTVEEAPPPESPDKPTTPEEQQAFQQAYERPKALVDRDIDREMATREICRRRLMPFIKRFRPKYNAGWVHEDICRRLEQFVKDVEDGKEPRLLLMMPPRAGKSEIGSRHLPAWILGKHPEWEIIAASHTSSLTMSFSRYVRDLIRDPAYTAIFPRTLLDPSSQSVENWNIVGGGGYLAAGVGTGITGRGAHVLLLDDLVKDIEAADSDTIRDNTWEWYASTAYTRLAPGGGVIGIMCMTGDTPVMMADGTQRRLDTLKPSDSIATYAHGTLASTTVAAVKSSGRDLVFKITMNSGRIVRANQRHPFLTVAPTGELSWTRLKNLTTALRIVVAKDSGVNGEALPALPRGVSSLPSVAAYAVATTTSRNGLTDVVQRATAMTHGATHGSSTATASPLRSTTPCTSSRGDAAPSAASMLKPETLPATGKTNSPSTIATTPETCEDYSATTATQESDILVMNEWHLPPLGISDFTLDEIVSIEPDGEEEVFDVQVDRTENFIANGAVSHNTWWHDDDWAGRIQQVMASGEGDRFEIIKYPAINDEGDEYLLNDQPGRPMIQIDPEKEPPPGAVLTRPMNTAIHPARYTTEAMLRIKRNLIAAGQQRVWNALYQQNPLPDEGILFTKDMFRYYPELPRPENCHIYQAWDFAITEGSENDYTVGVTLYQDQYDNLYVADVRRFRSDDSFVIVDEILDYAQEWGATLLGFEDGQIWKAMEAVFQRRCSERRQYPSFEILKPLTDKMVRASPLRGRMQLGKVWFDEKAPWFRDLFLEMTRFPNVKHDDQIDALAWTVRLTLTRSAPRDRTPKEKPLKSWKDKLRLHVTGGEITHLSA